MSMRTMVNALLGSLIVATSSTLKPAVLVVTEWNSDARARSVPGRFPYSNTKNDRAGTAIRIAVVVRMTLLCMV